MLALGAQLHHPRFASSMRVAGGAYRSLLLRATLGRSGERRVGLHVTAAVV
ncbi:hypothetical protein BN434_2231 [Erwinia amylovora CFBP 2585]|nr:hypothetical protein BN434_2231 [Erwinia amylovora CFBP 2585]